MPTTLRRHGVLATLTVSAVALVLTGCGALPGAREPASETPDVVASATPDVTTPEQAVLDFFAAFDEITVTGDVDAWRATWAPSCDYCADLADAATILQAVGQNSDAETLAAQRQRFEVTILPSPEVAADADEAVVDIEFVRPATDERAASSGTAEEATRARVTLAPRGATWLVTDVGALPGETAASAPKPEATDAVAALEQYLELERQVYLTGDSSAAEQMVHEECHACAPRLEMARGSFAAGMRMEGARSTVELKFRTPTAEAIGGDFAANTYESIFVLSTTVHREEATVVIDGVEQVHPAASYSLDASLWYDDGSWFVIGLAESL